MPAGTQTRFVMVATERAELGDEAGSLCPVEDVVLEVGDEYGVAPAELPVGVRSEPGGPAGAVAVEAEEVRGRIEELVRRIAVDERDARPPSRKVLQR